MSLVGGFPGFSRNKPAVRGPVNPLDKATIVSIFPREIDEFKPTISPGRFIIPPGSYESPSILVVGSSSWWREIDEGQPLLEIPVSSIQVADSVVKDYCSGLLACDMANSMPGLFYVPGEHAVSNIIKSYKHELDAADKRQKNWYAALIRLADALWARSNGNPLAICDLMRLAAQQMGQTSKDWMKEIHMVEVTRCKACGSLRNPDFPVCPTCKAVVDPVKAKELGLSFVTAG